PRLHGRTRSVLQASARRCTSGAVAEARIGSMAARFLSRTPERSRTHLVLIPSYNPGPKVFATVRDALDQWSPVWVVVDGSTDQTTQGLLAMAAAEPGLT